MDSKEHKDIMRKQLTIILSSAVLFPLSSLTYADMDSTAIEAFRQFAKAGITEECKLGAAGSEADKVCACYANLIDKYIDDEAVSHCTKNPDEDPNANNPCLAKIVSDAQDKAEASGGAECKALAPAAAGTTPTTNPAATTGGAVKNGAIPALHIQY